MPKASASTSDDIEPSGARPRPADSAASKELEITLRTRAEVLSRAASSDRDLVRQAAQAYCALGRFYADTESAANAIEAFRRASELDPGSTDAIRGARVLYTKAHRYQKALRMLLAEQARIENVGQRVELYRDEAVLRRRLGDLPGQSHALRLALRLHPDDSAIVEELARSIHERARLGYVVKDSEREEAAELFTLLARSLWPKASEVGAREPSSPKASQALETTPPPRRSREPDRGTQSSPPPQPAYPSLLPTDWAAPDSDWPRESPASLDAQDFVALAQWQTEPPPPAARAPSSDQAPVSTVLLPPPADAEPVPESVPVFELRKHTSGPPQVAPEAPSIVKAGLEASAPTRSRDSQRPQGDALIGRLFEALHTLEFLNDAPAGAEFVLRLVMDTLEVQVGIVHLYDINARSFVIASASGPKADALIELRSPESEPLLAEVMARGKPLLLADAQGHPLTSSGRWALLDCARSILCAPAQQEGRFLGAIEVANPVDGSPFTEDDLNAMSYVAERFTRFLAVRGIVLSTDGVSAAE